jgi:hypothetical protein
MSRRRPRPFSSVEQGQRKRRIPRVECYEQEGSLNLENHLEHNNAEKEHAFAGRIRPHPFNHAKKSHDDDECGGYDARPPELYREFIIQAVEAETASGFYVLKVPQKFG